MLRVNNQISELDLGDQIILEKEEKTLSFNSVGRIIYLQLKDGKSEDDVVERLSELYGNGHHYRDDVNCFVNQLLELGVIEKID